jgi:hypothetical protein
MTQRVRDLILAAALLGPAPLFGQRATQEIEIGIRAINAIEIHGISVLSIPAQRVGASPVVTRTAATYAVTTNELDRRIAVSIDAPMPEGTTLTMKMGAPAGGVAVEAVELQTAPQIAVTGISRLNQRDLPIEYSLIVAPGAVVKAMTTRTVSLTLISGV